MSYKKSLLNIICPLFLVFAFNFVGMAQNTDSPDSDLNLPKSEEALSLGEKLFTGNCQRCHFICEQGIGPALAGVNKRRHQEWLIRFIKNSQKVIASGDPYARHLQSSYNNVVMPNFETLTNVEIRSILSYIDERTINTYDTEMQNSTTMRNLDVDITDPQKSKKVDYYHHSTNLKIPESKRSVVRGEQLFRNHCEQCHEICAEKIGPPLATVTDRRPLPWLMDFIKNPQEVIEQGDEYAIFLWSQYDEMMVPTSLKEEEILDILAFIRHESGSPVHISGTSSPNSYQSDGVPAKVPEGANGKSLDEEEANTSLVVGQVALAVIMVLTIVIFAYFLIKIYRNMHRNKSKIDED